MQDITRGQLPGRGEVNEPDNRFCGVNKPISLLHSHHIVYPDVLPPQKQIC